MRIFILFIILVSSIISQAKVEPSIEWKKIETPHFEVIFNEKHTELARRYAEYAEIAYKYLVPVFKEAPDKTALIINDNTDQANGYATFVPYPHMMIYPVLPLPDMTISHYDYWGLGLIIHEYAHILSFYPSHGIYAPFNYLLGNIVRPLGLLPRWYLEGLAVAMETRYTSHGRLRSSDTQAAIRAYIRDKNLKKMTIDKINQGDNNWPYGSAPYLFGSLVWQKAIDEKGPSIVNKLLQKSSRRLPWTLNGTFESFYKTDLQRFLNELYEESIESYKAKPNFGIKHKMKKKHSIIEFSLSPDKKKMLTLQSNPEKGTRLFLHERTSKRPFDFSKGTVLTSSRHTQRIGWFKNSKTIYYDKIDSEHKRYNKNFKLFTLDLKTKKQKLIKTSFRDYQPHISDNNKKITYIKNGSGQNYLYIANIDGSNETQLYKPDLEVRLAYPTFINDKDILFVERNYEGEQNLKIINSSTKDIENVESELEDISKIRRQGKNYLFVSYQNGTKNIYTSKYPFVNARALTDSDTAANSGIYDPAIGRIYISQLTSRGNKIYSIKKSNFVKSSSPKAYQKVVNYDWPRKKIIKKPNLGLKTKIKDYSPWKYLIPKYWVPYAFNVNDGFVFQGSTSTFDPLAKHGLSLGFGYDTITRQPSYSAAYLNSTSFLDIMASFGVSHEPLAGTINYYKNTNAGLSTGFYLPGLSNSWRGVLTGRYLSTEQRLFPDDKTELAGPGIGFSYGKLSNFGSNLKSGFVNFGVSHNHYIGTGNFLAIDLTKMNLVYNFNHFLPNKHYIIFKLNGALAENIEDNGTQLNNDLITYGIKTIGGNFIGNLVNSNILMRGYSSGAFTGKQLGVASLAYDFPLIKSIYKGVGSGPFFFKSISANIFTDAISLKGRYLFTPEEDNPNKADEFTYVKTNWDEVFLGSGIEFRLSTTFSYHVPVDLVVGAYYGHNIEATGGFSPFITLAIGGFGPLGKKKNKFESLLF